MIGTGTTLNQINESGVISDFCFVAGEYTVGLVPSADSAAVSGTNRTDKKLGVVALTMFDLKKRGKISWLGLCGTSAGKTLRAARYLLESLGAAYRNLDTRLDAVFPRESGQTCGDESRNPKSYEKAIDTLPKGSAVTIFTPDSTHFEIALYALQRDHHVMLAKPATLTAQEHYQLAMEAKKRNLVCCVEFHKRFDPIYADARDQMRTEDVFGDLGFFNAYMSQPKYQLQTFKSWAGKESDISYYLNSHHIDFLLWSLGGKADRFYLSARDVLLYDIR